MILDQEKIARIKNSLKFKPRGMSISEIAHQLRINRNSAAKYLEILLMNGEVEAKKLGTSKVYTISQRVPVSALLSFSSDLIVMINLEGRVLQVNDPFLLFFGIPRDELVGNTIRDIPVPFLQDIIPDDFFNKSPEKKTQSFEKTEKIFGKQMYFRVKLVPTIFDSSDEGITIILEDISDHKRAEMALTEREQQYRAVIENIQDVFYRSDTEGTLIMASPSWASLLGYDSLDECIGRNIAATFYQEPEKRRHFLDAVYAKGRVQDFEVTLKTKDGQPFFVATNSHLYYDNSGNILGIEGIFRDINERHIAAEKIQNYVAQMEFFSRALQEFIELSPDSDLFEKIGNDLQSLIPGAILCINSFDNLTGLLTIRSVNLPRPQDRVTCEQILQRELTGLNVPLSPLLHNSLRNGHLHVLNISLHEASSGSIPAGMCKQIERELNFGDTYSIGFTNEGNLFGNVAIFLQEGAKIPDTRLVETYVRAASIALQKKIAEISLKESEEIFHSVAEESPFPLAIIDNQGNFRYINNSFIQLFGYDSRDFLSGRQWFLLVFPEPEYRKYAVNLWKSDIAAFSNKGTVPREFFVRCRDGSIKEVIFRVMLLSNKEKCIICEDISERREAEKVRKLLACIVESSHDAIIGKKTDGTIVSWNAAAERMYGYSLQEITGKNISLIVPPDRRDELENILKRVRGREGISDLETQRVKKDGTRINILVTISPIIDEEGHVVGASTISRDITHRRSEELLRENDDYYQSLIENIQAGSFRSTGDTKGRFIRGNASLIRILGYPSLEKLTEINIADLFVEPGGWKKVLDELKKSGFVKNQEILLRHPDKKTIFVSLTAQAKSDQSGQIESINGIIEDITVQKQTTLQIQVLRQELADIIEFLPDPAFVIDQEHRVIAWNSAIEQMTGTGKKEILGRTDFAQALSFEGTFPPVLIDLIDAPDDEIKNYYPDMIREGRSLVANVFVPSLNSGRGAYLWTKASPLDDTEGRRIGAIEIIRDISKVRELEELLKNAKSTFVTDTLGKISIPGGIDPVQNGHTEIKTPGVLSLLYLSNALKMAQDFISILDLSGRCIWVNDSFVGIISQKKNDTIIGKSFAQFIAPEDRKIALDSLIDVRKIGRKRVSLSLLTQSGRIPAEACMSAITDDEETVLGYMTIIRHVELDREKPSFKNNIPEKQLSKKRLSKG